MAYKVGRPRILGSPEEFEELANAYFDRCTTEGEPFTITGLALGVGLANRQSLHDYRRRPEFSDVVKRAMAIVENGYERALWGGTKAPPAGPIFVLKNMGWTDRVEAEVRTPEDTARAAHRYLVDMEATVPAAE